MLNVKTKNKSENYIGVPNEWYIDSKITNEELVVYCLLQRNYILAKTTGTSSINLIKEYMYIENRNPKIIKSIKDAIKGLLEKEIIYNLSDIHDNEIKFEDLKNDTYFNFTMDLGEKYYQVYEYTLDMIFKYLADNSSNINKFSLLRYFIAINRVIHSQADFGWLTQAYVKKICGKSESVQRYNRILQDELHIIQYNNNYMTQERHYVSTYFGWYGDNENFNFQLKFQVDAQNLIPILNKDNSNKNRSITQKINKAKNKINDTAKDEEIAMLKAKVAELEKEKSNNNIKTEKLPNNMVVKNQEDKPKHFGKAKPKSQQEIIDEEYAKKPVIFNIADDIVNSILNEENVWEKDEEVEIDDININDMLQKDDELDPVVEQKVKEIENYVMTMLEKNPSKELEYMTKYGAIKWTELKMTQIDYIFGKVKSFFIQNTTPFDC